MDILFAVLPFADIARPSLGVSLLDAGLARRGITASIEYLNFDLAERIGLRAYGWFAQCSSDPALLATVAPSEYLAGEWFYADLVFPGRLPAEEEYIERFFAPHADTRKFIPEIIESRRHRQEFVDHCVLEIERRNPRVVGFTTTFHQTCACLAVARRLKESARPPIVLFGGANCEGVMGLQLLRAFPWIDYVCTGEGDEAVPLFLERLLRDENPASVPGILGHRGTVELSSPAPVRDMDSLPLPNFSAYFERLRESPLRESITPRLLVETARGCWWGEKQHCTFCGLNGHTMSYRSKSPQRALHELQTLSETYGVNSVELVDNILDLKYLSTLFPELSRRGSKLEFFLETKSNLRFEQLRTLWQGGVRVIQPGIESFSNSVLQLMKKGCTGLQNIQLLRWCEELGLTAHWNLLCGFPGEAADEYARMAELVPLLEHLQPPGYCGRIHLDRFSPLFTGGDRCGVARIRPAAAYSYVFPVNGEQLHNLAYFFEFDYADGRDPTPFIQGLADSVRRWPEWNAENRPRLDLYQTESVLLLTDSRRCASKPAHVLSDLEAKLYIACDSAQSLASLARHLGTLSPETGIRALLQPLLDAGLMLEMDGHYLSLAVFRNRVARADVAVHPARNPVLAALPLIQVA